MERKYAIIYQSLDLETRTPIVTVLIDVVMNNGFEAVGRAYTAFSDRVDDLKNKEENYTIASEYEELEEGSGYIWEIEESEFIETWMMLEKEEE